MEHLLTFHELDEKIWLGQWMEKPREKKYFKVEFTDVLQKKNICILGSQSISCQAMSNEYPIVPSCRMGVTAGHPT